MKTIKEALKKKKTVLETMGIVGYFVCKVCGDKLDYKELPEHAQMTGHNGFFPQIQATK